MLRGVTSVEPGYAGGDTDSADYYTVATGKTGHAEVIKIEYDPEKITFTDLLTVFFGSHDPTTPNRQGADIGSEYRSLILYTTDEQKREAEQFIKDINLSSYEGERIVTEIKPLKKFYEAEESHKDFYEKNPESMYCQIVINPKLRKVQEKFAALLKDPEKAAS